MQYNHQKQFYTLVSNPKSVVLNLNFLFGVGLLVLFSLSTIHTLFFSNQKVEWDIVVLLCFLFLIPLLFLFAYIGIKKDKHWGKVVSYIVWIPFLLAFPVGTIFGAWVIYSLLNFNTETNSES